MKAISRRNGTDLQELATQTADLGALKEEWSWCIDQRDSSIFRRERVNQETRRCYWRGQTWDSRRWFKDPGAEEVFPWPGAADSRVPLIDLYVQNDVARLMVAWQQMRLCVRGVESNDAAFSNRMTHFLRWQLTQMPELRTEARFLANYWLERGKAVLGCFWVKQQQLGYQELDREDAAKMQVLAQRRLAVEAGMEGDEVLADLMSRLDDPDQEDTLVPITRQWVQGIPTETAREIIRGLREQGWVQFVAPYVIKNRPQFVALAANEDVFLPPEATSIESARGIHWREFLTESDLRERQQTLGWDPVWTAEVIATQRGRFSQSLVSTSTLLNRRFQGLTDLSMRRLFEVVHTYRRQGDERGVPGIYYTAWCPGLTDSAAWHGLLNYAHGQYPFHLLRRECRTRLVDEERGYGEAGVSFQAQLKDEWDSQADRASITTLPPSYYPEGLAPDKWGPGVQIPTNRPENYGFMKPPQWDPGSDRVRDMVRKFADQYFAHPTSELDLQDATVRRQNQVDDWMEFWRQVYVQQLQLDQQFMPEQFYFRVVGSNKGQSIRATRDEIQGQFDLTMGYNVRMLDPEYVDGIMGLLERALALDTTGRIDRAEAIQVAFELLDPNLGERLLDPAEAATTREADDEQAVLAQISSGATVDVKPGQAYGVRLQRLQQILQSAPDLQQRLAEDKPFAERFGKRVKQLDHQIKQFGQNAQIGRLGA